MPSPNDLLDLAMGSMPIGAWMVKPCVAERLQDLLNDLERDGFALHSLYNVFNLPMSSALDPKARSIHSQFVVVARRRPDRHVVQDLDSSQGLDAIIERISELEKHSHVPIDFSQWFDRIQDLERIVGEHLPHQEKPSE